MEGDLSSKSDWPLGIISGCFLLFIVCWGIIPERTAEHDKLLNIREASIEDKLDSIYLTERSVNRMDRAMVTIGDSIFLFKGFKVCPGPSDNGYKTLGEIKPPYFVIKDKGSSTFFITKDDVRIKFCPVMKSKHSLDRD